MVAMTPGNGADPEEHDHGHEIDERWRGLHRVEDRSQEGPERVASPCEDAQRDAHDDAEHYRGDEDRQRDHCLVPEAEERDYREGQGGGDTRPDIGEPPAEDQKNRDDAPEGHEYEAVQRDIEHLGDRPAECLEEGAPLVHHPVHAGLDVVIQRKNVFLRDTVHHGLASW